MELKLAFVGFRHGHIFDLYRRARESQDIEVVGACEEDAGARKDILKAQSAQMTHESYSKMLDEVECDAVAVGDYYGARGRRILDALDRGKHVMVDKPVCVRLDELGQIAKLCRGKNLKLGCMLDSRDASPFIGLRNVLRQGLIGEVHALSIGGQHPLLRDSRPAWYFEEGKHGGTINDIAIHMFNFVPWMTGLELSRVNAARTWTALAQGTPMKDAAQFMLTLSNGAGLLGDVSYFMPNSQGYSNPYYWRTTVYGQKGILETAYVADSITAVLDGKKETEKLPLPPANPGGYLQSFLRDIQGQPQEGDLTTEEVLRTAHAALMVQKAADEGLVNLRLDGERGK